MRFRILSLLPVLVVVTSLLIRPDTSTFSVVGSNDESKANRMQLHITTERPRFPVTLPISLPFWQGYG